jgi:predicted Zn-dependent protease
LKGSRIYIRDDGSSTDETLFLILLHELGHAIGLTHSVVKHSIMDRKVSAKLTDIEVGWDTKEELERMYGRK